MNGLRTANRAAAWLITLLGALFIVFPIWYMLVMSVTTTQNILSNTVTLFPTAIDFGNIKTALLTTPLVRSIGNTLFVSAAILFLQVITCELAAFGFAFLEFKGKKVLFLMIVSTMMIPSETTIVANYLTVSSWHWIDTYQVLIIPYMTSAMGIFLIRQFFLTLPKEIHEAAFLDGCSNFRFLIHIATPLSKSALGAFGIVSFLGSWNMYTWPLLVTNDDSMRMVQVIITQLQDADAAQSVGVMLAGAAIVTVPSILVFLIGHRQLIEGITAGAVKG